MAMVMSGFRLKGQGGLGAEGDSEVSTAGGRASEERVPGRLIISISVAIGAPPLCTLVSDLPSRRGNELLTEVAIVSHAITRASSRGIVGARAAGGGITLSV